MAKTVLNHILTMEEGNGRLRLEFTTDNNLPTPGKRKNTRRKKENVRANPSDYEEVARKLAGKVQGRRVHLKGRGPVEAYASLSYYLVLFGASAITLYENNLKKIIRIYPLDGHAPKPDWFKFTSSPDGDRARLVRPENENQRWGDEVIRTLYKLSLSPEKPSSRTLTLTGNGAVAMYAALGCLAAREGYANLVVDKPALPYLIHFSKDLTVTTPVKPPRFSFPGFCLGILGDPNSGKSVFSRTFYHCCKDLCPDNQIWIYDCDMAAPTPDWYCQGKSSPDEAVRKSYDKQRSVFKHEWSMEKELQIVQDLQNLKSNLQFIIADLPGGKHPKPDGKWFPPERIPGANRAEMMRQCDAFILLCNTAKPTVFGDWMDALWNYDLADRVAAKVFSLPLAKESDPVEVAEPLDDNKDGPLTCAIRGLYRVKTDTELIQALQPMLRSLGKRIIDRVYLRRR
ncbi:MAG: hypothetical protein IKO65_05180 [Victivallales bacterium]|nr:hypothetical protein [Victivallales bacterium]